MKKLLTTKEMFANTVESELRGKTHQGTLAPMEFESFMLMKYCFKNMGLEDYIEMEYDGESKTAFVRCIIEE